MNTAIDNIRIESILKPDEGISFRTFDSLIHLYATLLMHSFFIEGVEKSFAQSKENIFDAIRVLEIDSTTGNLLISSPILGHGKGEWSGVNILSSTGVEPISAFYYATSCINKATEDFHFFQKLEEPVRTEIVNFANFFEKYINRMACFSSLHRDITLTKSAFQNLKSFLSKKQDRQKAIITGFIEKSKKDFILRTKKGMLKLSLPEKTGMKLKNFKGKYVRTEGILQFGNDDNPEIYILEKINLATKEDAFFDRIPAPINIKSLSIEELYKKYNYHPDVSRIVGKWPGDETYEELLEMLEEIK